MLTHLMRSTCQNMHANIQCLHVLAAHGHHSMHALMLTHLMRSTCEPHCDISCEVHVNHIAT